MQRFVAGQEVAGGCRGEVYRALRQGVGDRLLNKRGNPVTKKVRPAKAIKERVAMESETQLRNRLSSKLVVKDDPVNKLLYFDATVNEKRVANKDRDWPKKKTLATIEEKKQANIDEQMTLYFD